MEYLENCMENCMENQMIAKMYVSEAHTHVETREYIEWNYRATRLFEISISNEKKCFE